MRTLLIVCVLSSIAHSSVFAAPRPLPADQHRPVVFLDVPSLWIGVVPQGSEGYLAKAFVRVGGATSKGDRLRIEWRSGGKVIAIGQCGANWDQDEQSLHGECELEKNLKIAGPIEIDVVYSDDREDKDYLVTTLKTTVRNWKEGRTSESWGIIPDDLLAVAFVRNMDTQSYTQVPLIQFWSSNDALPGGHPSLRCTVDGKQIPEDFAAHIGPASARTSQSSITASFTTPKLTRTYNFTHYQIEPGFRYGPVNQEDKKNGARFAADNPGKWDCFLRQNGKRIRQFQFTVDNSGMIQPSEMQRGRRALRTLPDVVLIDMQISDPSIEKRIRRDAIRTSIGFGLPWPDHPRAKELQAAFPPSSGIPD